MTNPMPTLPPGRYTRQRIRDLALNRAGNRALDAEAKDWLAQHLFELYTLADWPFLYVTAGVTITGPTFALPTDFVTPQDDHALEVVAVDGQPCPGTFVAEVSPELIAAHGSGSSATGAPPIYWSVSRSDTTGRVFPDPAGRIVTATLRYRRLPPEPNPPDEPADIPVFPYHNYLVQAVYVFALEHERDARAAAAAAVRDNLLQAIRRGASPVRSQRMDIPLDPLVFGTPFRGD
jgi:hypothetical protein